MYDRVQRNALLITTILTVLIGMILYWRWLDLFPLIEFRQQIEFNLPISWVIKNVLLSGKSIFSVPLYFNTLVGQACGTEVYCLNGSLLAIIIVTALMIILLLKRLGFRWTTSVIAGILWLIGLPVLDSMAWQATNLDKISALLVVIGIYVGIFWLHKIKSGYDVFLCSTSLLFITVLAYNSKPSAWVLIPILFLLPIVERGSPKRLWFISLVPPTIYATLCAGRTLQLVANDAFYSKHVTSGDPLHNLWTFLGYMNGSSSASIYSTISVILVIMIVIYGIKFRIARYQIGILSSIGLAGALSIALRTKYASSFYMLVPSIFFVMAIAVVFEVAIEERRLWIRGGILTIIAFFAVIFTINIIETRRQYEIVYQQSTSFRQSLASASTYLDNTKIDQITFVVDDSNYLAYKFVSGGSLDAYIFSRSPEKKIRYNDITVSQWHGGVIGDRTAYLVFDFWMNLVDIVINGKNVFTK